MPASKFEPTPIQRASAAQQIAGQIRAAMLGGALAAGQRLPSEHELAVEYSVSRPTVREAMRILATDGLIRATRGAAGGTFVALPAPDAVAESLSETIELWFRAGSTSAAEVEQARSWIERGCVRLAAEHRTPEDLEAIAAAVDDARDPAIDLDHFLELDIAFHVAISRAAHNGVLELAMTAIHLARPRTNTLLLSALKPALIVEQHDAILHAIRARDPLAAERAFEDHLAHLTSIRAEALEPRDAQDIPVASLHEAHPAVDVLGRR
jgi:GntR family transcriptional regulator, transcriptional repressor for pyruvate dehydrogenase complex